MKFIKALIKRCITNELPIFAGEITYKLLLSLFPFIIFLMTLVGFFNIDSAVVMSEIKGALSGDIVDLIEVYIKEVVDKRNVGLLSFSLVVAIFSASSGFLSIIKALNRAYGNRETRNFLHVRIVSMGLVAVFSICIIASVLLLVYGDQIAGLQLPLDYSLVSHLIGLTKYLVAMVALLVVAVVIYKLSSSAKVDIKSVLPGAIVTSIVWVVSTKIFNIYVNNFGRYSMIYGSIGSIFILLFWLNIVSNVLLIGGEINALIAEDGNAAL